MSAALDILWSPNKNNIFILLSGDTLTLFKVDKNSDQSPNAQSIRLGSQRLDCCIKHFSVSGISLSERTHASPIASTVTPNFVRCLSWCPTLEFGYLLAAGSSSGTISVLGFPDDPYAGRHGFLSLQSKEFASRHPRVCNCVAWNLSDCRYIAAGFDRHRNDCGLVVYDVFALSGDQSATGKTKEDFGRVEVDKRIVYEFSPGDHFVSCSWFQQTQNTIIAGAHGKGLRVFDLRDAAKPRGPTTKLVYGVCIDPFSESRIASFADQQISIWDLRNFEKPIAHHDTPKAISHLGWSPTRYGLLGATMRDSSDFSLLDVQHAHITQDEYDPVILQRNIRAPDEKPLACFSWHPRDENRALMLTISATMYDVRILERMTLNWSKTHHLLWACGREMHYFTDQAAPDLIIKAINEDISVRMKTRATNHYGMLTERFTDNIPLLGGDLEPEGMWKWLEYIRNNEGFDSMDGINFRGIKNILSGKMRSEIAINTFDGSQRKDGITIYHSPDRDHVLRLCGWNLNKDSSIEMAVSKKLFERAAAISVFHFNLAKAVDILESAVSPLSPSYNLTAIALSGYSEDSSKELPSLWQTLSFEITKHLNNAYIRNIFLFLSSHRSESTLKRIVLDQEILLEDRLGFACTFLPDGRLIDFVAELDQEMISKGKLEGLILTGFGSEGVDLVQRYVDNTGDVQTASLISSIITTKEWSEDPRPHQWVDHYRDVLDSWMLWGARASFDVFYNQLKGGGPRVARQIAANCTFCGKNISHLPGTTSISGRGEKMFAKTPNISEIPKVMSCSSCGKTLPRCAVCQINMGTPTNMGFVTGEPDAMSVKKASKISPIEKWFAWCQSCRHGGHAAHLSDWFKDHSECPVTGCMCKCMMIESGCATVANNRRRVATSN